MILIPERCEDDPSHGFPRQLSEPVHLRVVDCLCVSALHCGIFPFSFPQAGRLGDIITGSQTC